MMPDEAQADAEAYAAEPAHHPSHTMLYHAVMIGLYGLPLVLRCEADGFAAGRHGQQARRTTSAWRLRHGLARAPAGVFGRDPCRDGKPCPALCEHPSRFRACFDRSYDPARHCRVARDRASTASWGGPRRHSHAGAYADHQSADVFPAQDKCAAWQCPPPALQYLSPFDVRQLNGQQLLGRIQKYS